MERAAREKFWTLADEARTRGKDLAEVLDRAGILLTERRRRESQAIILEQLAQVLESTSAAQWLRGQPGQTPNDLKRAITEHIHTMAQERRIG